jgi:membrane protease YdiL (CAAX protease family)
MSEANGSVQGPESAPTHAGAAEQLKEAARPIPWRLREVWLAAALPGALLVILSMIVLAAGDILNWSPAELGASSILFGPSLVLVGWLLFVRGTGLGRKDLGFRAFGLGGSLFVPMLLVVDFIFVLAYTGLLDMYGLLPVTKPTETLPLAVTNTVVVAPLCEEVFYRAVLFAGLRHYYGPRKAALLSAAIFSFYHLDPLFFVPHFISGVVLAALLDATGSIWPSILLHAAWNTWIVLGEAGFWIVALIAFLTMAAVAISPLWFALHRFWQRAGGSGPPSSA